MKYILSALFCVFCFVSCVKPAGHTEVSKVYTGKVLHSICGNTAIQFTDGTKLGQVAWVNPLDSTTHDYVFKIANPCTSGPSGAGNTIRFTFTRPSTQDCMQCMAWAPTPDTAYNIHIIE